MQTEFNVVVRPHPLRSETVVARVPVGCTLGDLGAGHYVTARVDGDLIEDLLYTPREGQHVVLQAVAGGSNGGKMALRLVAAIAITYVSYGTAGAAAGSWAAGATGLGTTAAWQAGFALAGNLALNAVIPPPSQKFDASASAFTPFRSTSNANSANPFGVIPRIYGKHKIFPPLAAYPTSEETGGDQFAALLFCLGYGPLTIDTTSFKLGDTSLREFYNSDEDYAANIEVREGTPGDAPLTLYARNSVETSAGKEFKLDNDTATLTTNASSTDFSLDIVAPGLIYFSGKKKHRRAAAVGFKIEYKPHSGSTWATATSADAVLSGKGGFATNFPLRDGGDLLHGYSDLKDTIFHDAPGGASDGGTGQKCFYILGDDTKRYAITVKVTPPTPGAYDVRVTRIASYERNDRAYSYDGSLAYAKGAIRQTPPDDDLISDCTWTVLRSFAGDVLGTIPPDIAFVAMRIKTTGNVGGTIDNFSCVATSRLPVLVDGEWIEQETSNPAWIYRAMLLGPNGWAGVTRRAPAA